MNAAASSRAERRRELVEGDLKASAELRHERISDEEFWRRAAIKPFYSGKLSSVIRAREAHMLAKLGDAEGLCEPDWDPSRGRLFREFLEDKGCARNPQDLTRSINAARRMQSLRAQDPLKRSLIDYYVRPADSMKSIHARLLSHLGLGYVTTLHFMTDLGLPVVKPDRVLNRTAIRLGLIRSYAVRGGEHLLPLTISGSDAEKLGSKPEFNWALQSVCHRLAEEAKTPMRTLDLLLVKMGQQPDEQFGYARTICDDEPLCHLCEAQPMCAYGSQRQKRNKM